MFQYPVRLSYRVISSIGAFILAAILAGVVMGQSGASEPFDGAQTSAISTAFTYQGQLRNNGALVNGECDFDFDLWTAGSGGSTVASTNSFAAVPVNDGQFFVTLDFGDSFPTSGERWLEVNVRCPAGSGDYTSLGMQQLTATPYALMANNADKLDSLDSSSFSLSSHDHAGQDWPTVNTTYGLRVDNSGSYGVYGTGSSYGLYGSGGGTGVLGSGTSYGLYGVSSDFAGVYGDGGAGAGDYGGYFTGYNGVFGNAENAAGYGVYGTNSGGGYGVYGVSGAGNGVFGDGGSGSGDYGGEFTGYSGVYGNAENSSGYGVYGTGSSYGVYGNSTGSGYGVFGSSGYTGVWGQGTSYGVIGINANTGVYGSGSTYSLFGSGPAYISGFLTKAGGGFKIDHPQYPDNKYLVHSFVESPDMMNVYNGNATLDENGQVWVQLPEYFEALNMEFRYQLTAIGVAGPGLYVAAEIENNRFQIAGGEPGAKVSWQVTGIRNDPWAQENRPDPVQEKPAEEEGIFLHPELYGQAKEQGFDYLMAPKLDVSEEVQSNDR